MGKWSLVPAGGGFLQAGHVGHVGAHDVGQSFMTVANGGLGLVEVQPVGAENVPAHHADIRTFRQFMVFGAFRHAGGNQQDQHERERTQEERLFHHGKVSFLL